MPVVAVEWDKLQGAPEVRGLEEMVVQEQVQPEVQVIQIQEAAAAVQNLVVLLVQAVQVLLYFVIQVITLYLDYLVQQLL